MKAEKPAEKSAPTTEAAETKEVLSSEEGITKTVPETPDIDTARETTEVVKVRAKRGTYAVIMRAVRTKKNATAIMRRINRRESTWETEAKAFGVQGHNLRSAVVRMLGAEFRPTYAQNQPYEEEQGKKWSWPVIVGISLILTIAIADVMTLFHIPPFR